MCQTDSCFALLAIKMHHQWEDWHYWIDPKGLATLNDQIAKATYICIYIFTKYICAYAIGIDWGMYIYIVVAQQDHLNQTVTVN